MEVWTFEGLLRRCKEAGIEPAALLERAGVNPANLWHWKRGRLPNTGTMRKIMDAFPAASARAGTLEGRLSGADQYEVWTFEELRRRCGMAGITPLALLKRAGVEPSNLFYWRRGRLPNIPTMRRIMRAFPKDGIQVDPWTFEELLRWCEEAGVEVVALLRQAGVEPNNLFYWRRGRVPKAATMHKVMAAFPGEARRAKRSARIWTFEDLLQHCGESGVTPNTLLKRAGVEPSNLFYWRRGRLPKASTMRRIMRALPREGRSPAEER